jgi:hypothetical protein
VGVDNQRHESSSAKVRLLLEIEGAFKRGNRNAQYPQLRMVASDVPRRRLCPFSAAKNELALDVQG